jgi:hypothetical protein
MQWFDVDKQGLAKLLERRGKAFAITELIQNAWDTNAKCVKVSDDARAGGAPGVHHGGGRRPGRVRAPLPRLHPLRGVGEEGRRGEARPVQPGREARPGALRRGDIVSTKGTVEFDSKGRKPARGKREFGSEFWGRLRMTRAEYDEAMAVVRSLLPPMLVEDVRERRGARRAAAGGAIEASLPTEIADAEGVLRRSVRKTRRRDLRAPKDGETRACTRWASRSSRRATAGTSTSLQKVPLNFDRDNLPPAYLRTLRVLVLNEMTEWLEKGDANATWVRDAGSDKDARTRP